jgi:dienelactone hydrolase
VVGRNPYFEDEDLLRVVAGPDIGFTDREVKINPLGGYAVFREGQFVNPGSDQYLVATRIAENEWTVELAFPLNLVSASSPDVILASVERIRAARPGSPQQRWHWPQQGPVSKPVVLSRDWNLPAPAFQPESMASRLLLQAGRVPSLPPMEAGWQEAAWAAAPALHLLRDEPAARAPRFPTEVKLLHDGETLAVLARCADFSGSGRAADSLRLFLATSGGAYTEFNVNPLGIRADANGLNGGSRVSRGREWNSGARTLVRETAQGWLVRTDVPLEKVAAMLGETRIPAEWRMLLMRSRAARGGEPQETSVLPAIHSDTPVSTARYARLVLAGGAAAQPNLPEAAAPPFETRVLSSAERERMSLPEMLGREARGRARKIIEEDDAAWAAIRTREDWERYKEPRIKALAATMSPFPDRTPLNVRVTQEYAGRGYRRQNLVYSSRPGMWVTANLYLPEKPPPRMPGFVIIHSHHSSKSQSEMQDMGILWARVGCAVLMMDMIGHGERLQNYPWNREHYHSRYNMGMQLYTAGESLLKWMVWDIIRGVDLLLERKDVDPDRIIMLGSVAAGAEPVAVAAALDKRIAAVAPFNFNRTGPGLSDWESTRSLRRSIVDRFFAWVIDASVAPRRLVYAIEMGWENYRTHESWERFQKVFALYGAPQNLDDAHGVGTFPGPGECNNIGPSQRKTLYPELNRWFGIPVPPEEPNDRRPEPELAALTPAVAAELKMTPIYEMARGTASSKLKTARAALEKLPPAERRAALRRNLAEVLGDIQPNPRPEVIARWKKTWAGAEVEAVTLETQPGIVVPLLLLKPASQARPPVVMAVSQGGKERILQLRRAEVEALLRAGVAVCLPDVRGTGETAPGSRRGPSSEETYIATMEFMLGNTLLGGRLKDARTVLAWLATRGDLDANRIALWGDTPSPANPERILDETPGWQIGPQVQYQAEPMGALLAILGALYEDNVRAVAARGGLAGYLALLQDNFAYVPNDAIVPGILEKGDVADAVAAVAPRPVLLEAMVDGRNRVVPDTALRSWFAPQAGLETRAASGDLALWLTKALSEPRPQGSGSSR